MLVKVAVVSFLAGVVAEGKPFRLGSRLLVLSKKGAQWVGSKLALGTGKVDEVLDEKVSEDE